MVVSCLVAFILRLCDFFEPFVTDRSQKLIKVSRGAEVCMHVNSVAHLVYYVAYPSEVNVARNIRLLIPQHHLPLACAFHMLYIMSLYQCILSFSCDDSLSHHCTSACIVFCQIQLL